MVHTYEVSARNLFSVLSFILNVKHSDMTWVLNNMATWKKGKIGKYGKCPDQALMFVVLKDWLPHS